MGACEQVTTELSDCMVELRVVSSQLCQVEAHSRPGESSKLKEKMERLVAQLPRLREEEGELTQQAEVQEQHAIALAKCGGGQHMVTLLEHRCQWRRWQQTRMERVLGMTMLRDTRKPSKRAKELQLLQAEAEGSSKVVNAMTRHTITPPCTLTCRPGGYNHLPAGTTLAQFNHAMREHLLRDLAESLDIEFERLEMVSVGMAGEEEGEEEHLSLELKAAGGSCDVTIRILHTEEGVEDEGSLPESLLHELTQKLPYGEVEQRRVAAALRIEKGRSLDFKILDTHVPTLERVNVRRVLNEYQTELLAAAQEAEAKLAAAVEEKAAACEYLEPGVRAQRNKELKLTHACAASAKKMCARLLEACPHQHDTDEFALQFDWLPLELARQRREIEELSKSCSELLELKSPMEARERGKVLVVSSQGRMHQLSEAYLPPVTPPLENAGKLVLPTLSHAFYQTRELLYARKSLACNLSHFASIIAAEASTGFTAEKEFNASPNAKKRRKGVASQVRSSKVADPEPATPQMERQASSFFKKRASVSAPATPEPKQPPLEVLQAGGAFQRVKAMMLLTPSAEMADINHSARTPQPPTPRHCPHLPLTCPHLPPSPAHTPHPPRHPSLPSSR